LAVPDIETNPSFTAFDIYDEMIFGKLITSADISLMVPRYDWTYNTVYDVYNPFDSALQSKKFFVVSQESGNYHVFKCLNNASGAASTFQPKLSETSADDNQYYTADGYHWKYLYTITSTNFLKFSTSNFMPS